MKRKFYPVALSTPSAAGIGSACAANIAGNDALAIKMAKISMTQAEAAAGQCA